MQKPKLRKLGRVFAVAAYKPQTAIVAGPDATDWTKASHARVTPHRCYERRCMRMQKPKLRKLGRVFAAAINAKRGQALIRLGAHELDRGIMQG